MISSVSNNLSSEKIQQLLAAVGAMPKEDTEQIEATEYNWLEPHYFNDAQLEMIDKFMQKVAIIISGKFADFTNSKFELKIISITQHYVSELLKGDSETQQNDYYLPFCEEKFLCGLVGLPQQTAIVWARQLLGDEKTEDDSNRELSQLEESLLLDLVLSMVNTLSNLHPTSKFKSAENFVKGQWPLELQDTEELCKISLEFQKSDSEEKTTAYFLMPCNKLDSLAGKLTHSNRQFSDEEVSNAIIEHMKGIDITVTAQLASTMLTFEEIMNLQVDDIFLCDRRVDKPIELLIDNKTVCYGWPAQSSGQYALVISRHAESAAASGPSMPGGLGSTGVVRGELQNAKTK